MNKKHKNKNKSKLPNPVPPQKKQQLEPEKLSVSPVSLLTKESDKNDGHENFDAPPESLAKQNVSVEVNFEADVPQKPTRSRNNKNENDTSKENQGESNKNSENMILESEAETIESMLVSKKIEDEAEAEAKINPQLRKKNKKKKVKDDNVEAQNQTLQKPTKNDPDSLNLPVAEEKCESTKQGVVYKELVLDEPTSTSADKEDLCQQESQNNINKKKSKKKKKANLLPPDHDQQFAIVASLASKENEKKTPDQSDEKLISTKNDQLLLENTMQKTGVQQEENRMHVTDESGEIFGEPMQSQKKKKSKTAKPVQSVSKTSDLKINLSQSIPLANTEVKANALNEPSCREELTHDEYIQKGQETSIQENLAQNVLNPNECRKKVQQNQSEPIHGINLPETTRHNTPDSCIDSSDNAHRLLSECPQQKLESHDNFVYQTKTKKVLAENEDLMKIPSNSNELKSKVLEVSMDMEELSKSIDKSLDCLVNRSQCLEQVETLGMCSSEVISPSLQYQSKLEPMVCNLSGNNQCMSDADGIEHTDDNENHKNVTKMDESVLLVESEKAPTTITAFKNVEYKEIRHETKKQRKKNKESAVVSLSTSDGSYDTESNISKEESSGTKKSVEKADDGGEKNGSKCKKQNDSENTKTSTKSRNFLPLSSEVLDNFEDAVSTNSDDVNKSFEIIANPSIDDQNSCKLNSVQNNTDGLPNLNIPFNDSTNEKYIKEENKGIENPIVSNPKNLLGHYDIPATSNKSDYKKEKNKTQNTRQAKVKLKKMDEMNSLKSSKQSQTENRLKLIPKEASKSSDSEDEEYVYKYSFRKVFMPNSCNTCQAEIKSTRVTCSFCNLIHYCSPKHKEEDWTQHQAFCFAVKTIVHLKGSNHIYADAKGISGQDYRLLRMQSIVSCEKVLKRKLQPYEQEVLLYPRICAQAHCREWRSDLLKDCDGCGQIAHCSEAPDHVPADHQQWCKAYRLYFKLVNFQQSRGRIEPKLPSKVIGNGDFKVPDKLNELLAQLYGDNLDLDDIHYAALTQLATAPLTAAYSYQIYKDKASGSLQTTKKFVLHIVGAELQFEADTLRKWETFVLHIRPDIEELKVVFIGPELNPSKLPLDLLCKVKMCSNCRAKQRKVTFEYYDGQLYHEYINSNGFTQPNIVCAFNPGLHRITGFGAIDSWPETINSILKMNVPFCVTSYTKHELPKDLLRVKECAKFPFEIVLEPMINPYSSVRPDRNFISDDEMPLIFKNYFNMVLRGTPKPKNNQ